MDSARVSFINPLAPEQPGESSYQVRIFRPGWFSENTVDCSGVSAGWQTTGPRNLSAEFKTDELIDTFGTIDLRGRWLAWEHYALGKWSGEIQDFQEESTSGTTELAARDFSVLLETRRLAKEYEVSSASPGGMFKRIIIDAAREGGYYSNIRSWKVDETGQPIPISIRGGEVYDAVNTLADRSGDEWWIDDDLNAWWQHRRGSDKSGSIMLEEGLHIAGHKYSGTLGPIRNDLLAIPSNRNYAVSQSFVIEDQVSIKKVGRRQTQLVYTEGVTESVLRPAATVDLKKLVKLGDALELSIDNFDNCWASFGDGDSIQVNIPSINVRVKIRILARSYDTDADILLVTGEIEL